MALLTFWREKGWPADMVHAANAASLNGEFARVTAAAGLIAELKGRA